MVTITERNYRKEYDEYHATSEQKKNRAERNAAHNSHNVPAGKEVDHIKPLSKGGSNSPDNLRVVSRKTNRIKADKIR